MSFKTTRASGDMVSLVGPHLEARGLPTWVVNPTSSMTVEADSRARPTFELDVDSPGATRNCALLVRGSLTFRSFRHVPSQVETERTREAYDGQLVHPCRVKSFQKAMSTVMDDLRPT